MAERRNQFERKHRWLNGTAVLLHRYSGLLEKKLADEFQEGTVVAGVATAGDTTWLRGIQIDRDDAIFLLQDFSGFLKLSREQTLIGAFRALIDYMHDLLEDIAMQSPNSMPQALREKAKLRRIKASEFPGKLERIGLQLSPADKRYFELLRTIRNLLEHNDGTADTEYVTLAGGGIVGEKVQIDGERVRETLLVVRRIAINLESRAQQTKLIAD